MPFDILNDRRARGIIAQAIVLAGVVALIAALVLNAAQNLKASGVASGFGFLNNSAGFSIAMSLLPASTEMTYGDVLLIGALNTLLVSAFGIIAATILGVVLGVLKLSNNWLVSRLVGTYIEITRNLPLLLLILFWYSFALALPRVRESLTLGGIVLNNRGIYLPRPIFEHGTGLILWAVVVGLAIAAALSMWARKRRERTGRPFPIIGAQLFVIVALPVIAAIAMGVSWEMPQLTGFNYQGGIKIITAFFALWFALTTYTAAFIAEIVRSGIEAVPRGQREAAEALGLKGGQVLRLIVLPQAMRVIVPPLTSQYLNLLKNSSLAVAIGYPDIVQVFAGTTLNQTGQAIEVIAITMAFYLVISLAISVMMNAYNRAIALKDR